MSWEANEEKLLCLVVLDDRFAPRLSSDAGDAFFRGFVVQNRATGAISAKMRWKYRNAERSWVEVRPKSQDVEGAVAEMREGLLFVLQVASSRMGFELPAAAVKFFEPPDDGGDGWRTVEWLAALDLIEVVRPS